MKIFTLKWRSICFYFTTLRNGNVRRFGLLLRTLIAPRRTLWNAVKDRGYTIQNEHVETVIIFNLLILYLGIFLGEPLVSVSIALDDTGRNLSCHWWRLFSLWLRLVLESVKHILCVSVSTGLSLEWCFPISYADDCLWAPKTVCTSQSFVCFCNLVCNTHLSL